MACSRAQPPTRDATQADVHEHAVELGNALGALENAVVIAVGNDDGYADYWLLLLDAVQTTRAWSIRGRWPTEDPRRDARPLRVDTL